MLLNKSSNMQIDWRTGKLKEVIERAGQNTEPKKYLHSNVDSVGVLNTREYLEIQVLFLWVGEYIHLHISVQGVP